MKQTLSLLELNQLLAEVIEVGMPREYWVEAEISELREVRGHCYIDLIEKAEGTNTPVARASAKCWANTWSTVGPLFEKVTGQRLHTGMKVLMLVGANFHPAYGFSWIISDIDPTYTLGDMARKRQAIIDQLKREGVFDMQKELEMPLFCQHIAVISSANAAGYGDFVNQLESNAYGFKFHTQLFPATMQGEGVEQSIIDALNKIYASMSSTFNPQPSTFNPPPSARPEGALSKRSGERTLNPPPSTFDCVVIIRGGGATSDLSGFDTLALAENVAQFPLPVITGIGHERDESVLDMISHTRVKTAHGGCGIPDREPEARVGLPARRPNHACGKRQATDGDGADETHAGVGEDTVALLPCEREGGAPLGPCVAEDYKRRATRREQQQP